MTRNRSETAAPLLSVRNQSGPTPTNMDGAEHSVETPQNRPFPSIRFIPHHDPRAGRPSLVFPTISRTLPDDDAIIRVGRYSERDNIPEIPANVPSAAAVGFKSKVVSRKHCEFWCADSQWYIRDVKSSSGTFLNHIRLSQPNQESKPFKVKDGDVVQLGIDFRGGEEMIFRCVKIRIECNRNWQQSINTFNKQTHQRLRNLAKPKKDTDTASTHSSQECSICLMSIAPCQSLFVAPCSHVWHYKCIRPILQGPTWPNFLCPNCRAVADLEADVEEPDAEDWESEHEDADEKDEQKGDTSKHVTPRASQMPLASPVVAAGARTPNSRLSLGDLEAAISTIIPDDTVSIQTPAPPTLSTPQTSPSRLVHSPPPGSQPVHIVREAAATTENTALFPNRSTSDVTSQYALIPERVPECPMTPRNDAGPFVFDGSAGRGSVRRGIDEASTPSSLSVPSTTTAVP
ncbi:uncharacterized protein BDZ99DRAFT_394434 [Mytilinidion resinicola]|uniref:RING-type E3 ubiquitin transferase n=1 Tax=Mytilinidion resinicola TaxID=574789 RepID=A0A6A6YF80_9PEZI|nr:uncharacterized protein BDZ99DRAFT_394434 [Mytilinidion resinicola]KAF2806517.1 hypothetical protein BDZ99DRAFT_394434 [Mytilinidion resinicola]